MKPAARLDAILPFLKGIGMDGKGAQHVREVRDLLDECERVLAPFAEKWLHPDDIGPEMAAEIRADEDWNEAENDKAADDMWIERRWIRAARATLAKLKGEA